MPVGGTAGVKQAKKATPCSLVKWNGGMRRNAAAEIPFPFSARCGGILERVRCGASVSVKEKIKGRRQQPEALLDVLFNGFC